MAGKDKHPPLDPNRHSTNKRVKALGENIFGTKIREAEGAKRVRPGDPKEGFMPAGESTTQAWTRNKNEKAAQRQAVDMLQESFLTEKQKELAKRGSMTQTEYEVMVLQKRKLGGKRI